MQYTARHNSDSSLTCLISSIHVCLQVHQIRSRPRFFSRARFLIDSTPDHPTRLPSAQLSLLQSVPASCPNLGFRPTRSALLDSLQIHSCILWRVSSCQPITQIWSIYKYPGLKRSNIISTHTPSSIDLSYILLYSISAVTDLSMGSCPIARPKNLTISRPPEWSISFQFIGFFWKFSFFQHVPFLAGTPVRWINRI